MHLLQAFRDFIAKERLFSPGDRLLLAVSGGMDSVVLCELSQQSGFDFWIAHCNFQLRGAESDRDEAFVRDLGRRYGKEVLVHRWDTREWALSNRMSIQTAARALRYEWFDGLTGGHGRPGVILTGHHLDDNIETMLMNFFKGTGIAGLRGMLPRQGKIARPLLFADRDAIRRFAQDRGLHWVEDSSNETDDYTRNVFRHRILPLIEASYPSAIQNLAANLERFRGVERLYRQAIDAQKKRLLKPRGEEVHVPVELLKKAVPLASIIYELFSPYGFTPQQTGGIQSLLEAATGKYVCSGSHRILRNRHWLILSPLRSREAVTILIENKEAVIEFSGGTLHFAATAPAAATATAAPAAAVPPPDPDTAWLDAGQVVFPLILRPWRPGDYFYPLGMRKKKKLARFFIDQKLSMSEKERTWVLETNKKILWVVGRRIDERFRVTAGTKEVLSIRLRNADGSIR